MPTIDFRAHFAQVAQRPGMYGIDDRYRSAVAYVEGCDAATGNTLLEGMSEWLDGKMHQREGRGSIAYWGLIVDRRFPNHVSPWRFTADEESLLTADLFAALDEFLGERPHNYEVRVAAPM